MMFNVCSKIDRGSDLSICSPPIGYQFPVYDTCTFADVAQSLFTEEHEFFGPVLWSQRMFPSKNIRNFKKYSYPCVVQCPTFERHFQLSCHPWIILSHFLPQTSWRSRVFRLSEVLNFITNMWAHHRQQLIFIPSAKLSIFTFLCDFCNHHSRTWNGEPSNDFALNTEKSIFKWPSIFKKTP